MKKLLYLLFVLLLVLPTFVIAAQDTAVLTPEEVVAARVEEFGTNLPRGYGLISAADLAGFLTAQDMVLLDVRQPEEYEAGHLVGSFNVPIRELSQNLDLLPDKTASIVVICKGGGRAVLAATALELLGYENVKVLKGGFDGWAGEELPTTTDVFTAEAGDVLEFDPDIFAAIDTYLTNLPEGFGMVSSQNLMAEYARNPLPESDGSICCKSPHTEGDVKLTGEVVLLDVRSAEEWASGYIAGATHLWIDEFANHLVDMPADLETPIVVYCQSGYRGGIAAVMLNALGYTNVRNLSGGVNAWSAAGLPLVGVPAS
ncbi:MAG: rhodanese-like domain-containing protein [Anaerolineae bacterium]|nr:rhodanese-like domain-containing protein [Anaerolineae bacterium]